MTPSAALVSAFALLVLVHGAIDDAALSKAAKCNAAHGPISFVILENEAVNAAVEDDISEALAEIGFTVERRMLSKEDINVARQTGDFHFSITETWGTPYDPHTTASGWIDGLGGEGFFPAMVNFEAPASRQELLDMVKDVLKEQDKSELEAQWAAIHNYYHAQAVILPLWGKRVPTLLSTRFTGYTSGFQQFDYPVHKLVPLTGPTTVTIAPGSRSGLFKRVGGLNAHTYGPNEFFSNNWIYEGLVTYGVNGQVLPSLAASWKVEANNIGGDTYTFTLRENVRFHDGEVWNCAAAELNFDHILAGSLRDRHGWYGVPLYTEDWFCNNEMEFVLRTNTKHGPYLQELSFIRPIRMISPGAFVNGNSTDSLSSNSCHLDWGVVAGTETFEEVNCVGMAGIYGTGPFVFSSRDPGTITNSDSTIEEVDNKVVFVSNQDYWDGAPAIQQLEIIRYDTSKQVKTALLNGDLDIVWGSGVLSDSDIDEIDKDSQYEGTIRVFHSSDVQNVVLLLNSGKPPFDDINVRKTVIHAINKAGIVERELNGLPEVVDNVFPLLAPFCDIDLSPRWDYDLEKAILLSCENDSSSDSDDSKLALGLGLGFGIPFLISVVVAIMFYQRSKKFESALELNKKTGVQA